MPENYTPTGSTHVFVVPADGEAADGPKAFKDFADSLPNIPEDGLTPVVFTQASLTLAPIHSGVYLACVPSGGNLTVTIPSDVPIEPTDRPLPLGFTIAIGHMGPSAGTIVIVKGQVGVVIQNRDSLTVDQYRTAVLLKAGPNLWQVISGSDMPEVEPKDEPAPKGA